MILSFLNLSTTAPDPFTITENTIYGFTENIIYITIQENLGKNQVVNISQVFDKNVYTDKIQIKEISLKQNFNKDVYGQVNVSSGRFTTSNVSCYQDNVCTKTYFDNKDNLMKCSFDDGNNCFYTDFKVIGTESVYDYKALPVTQKTITSVLSNEKRFDSITIPANAKYEIAIRYSHPIPSGVIPDKMNKYDIKIISTNGADSSVLDPTWYNALWLKRKQVNITTTDQVGYPNRSLKLNITYDSDMVANFTDLRFTDDNGDELTYWFYDDNWTSGVSVYPIVKYDPNFSASEKAIIWVYYNNSVAGWVSNISNAGLFGDNFDNIDFVNKWYTGNTALYKNYSGRLTALATADLSTHMLTSRLNFTNYIALTKVVRDTGTQHIRFEQTNALGSWMNGNEETKLEDDNNHWTYINSGNSGAGSNTTLANYRLMEYKLPSVGLANNTIYDMSGTQIKTYSASPSIRTGYVGLWTYSTTNGTSDWILVKKYTNGSETQQTGAEESATASDTTKPSNIFNTQTPADLNVSNFLGVNGVNITYNITDETALNLTTIRLFYKANSSSSNTMYYQNGTSNAGYFPTAYNYNDSAVFSWQLLDNQVLPGTYNYGEVTLENTVHSYYNLTDQNNMIMIQLLNVSNSTRYGFFEIMLVKSVATGGPSQIYYCNSSYSVGNINANANCVNFYSLQATTSYNHAHTAYSSHQVIPFTMNLSSGRIGNVQITPISYFIASGSGGTGKWKYSYITSQTRANAFKNTSTSGASWVTQFYTVDAHLHQFEDNTTLFYYSCANDTSKNENCTAVRSDLFELGGLPPVVTLQSPANTTYRGYVYVNYTIASPNAYIISTINISLLNPDYSYNRTITSNNSGFFNYSVNTSNIGSGSFIISVQAIDNVSQSGYGYSPEFIIDNSTLNGLNFTSPRNITYTTQSILVNITNSTAVYTWWWNGTNNLTYTAPLVYNFSEGNHFIRAYSNTSGNVVTNTNVSFYVDSLSPVITLGIPDGYVYGKTADQKNITIGVSYNITDSSNITSSGYNFTNTSNVIEFSNGTALRSGIIWATLAEYGYYRVNITAKDEYGNTAYSSILIRLDTVSTNAGSGIFLNKEEITEDEFKKLTIPASQDWKVIVGLIVVVFVVIGVVAGARK